jgi:hypothetical protein
VVVHHHGIKKPALVRGILAEWWSVERSAGLCPVGDKDVVVIIQQCLNMIALRIGFATTSWKPPCPMNGKDATQPTIPAVMAMPASQRSVLRADRGVAPLPLRRVC